MKVEKIGYAGWNDYPVYLCRTYNDFTQIGNWCYNNGVETFLVSSGGGEYRFQVKSNHDWFVLRWV
jgi:hypothetical protein